MRGILKSLAKIGLVELEEGDRPPAKPIARPPAMSADTDRAVNAILQDDFARSDEEPFQPPASVGSSSTVVAPVASGSAYPTGSETPPAATLPTDKPEWATVALTMGRSFDQIYALARVPASPFPAEKLLRVLDGLKALDPNTRRAAVVAMDAADDDWTVVDSVLDAERKIEALERADASLFAERNQFEADARAALQAQDTYRERATAAIREEIAKLEQTLAGELEQVATARSTIEQRLQLANDAQARERARFVHEVARLREIILAFGAQATQEH